MWFLSALNGERPSLMRCVITLKVSRIGSASSSTGIAALTMLLPLWVARRLKHPDREAQQLAAGIAHEDAGRKGIEAQKPEYRAGEGQRQRRARVLAAVIGEDRERAQAQERRAARQPVEPVRKIDGIGDADQEQKGQREPRSTAGSKTRSSRVIAWIWMSPPEHDDRRGDAAGREI